VNTDALKILSEEESRSGEMAVIQKVGKKLQIAVRNPEKEKTKAFLEKLKSEFYSYSLFLVSKRSLEKAWSFYKEVAAELGSIGGSIEVSTELLEKFATETKTLSEVKEKVESLGGGKTTALLEIIIAGALSIDASDIHLEPQEEAVRLRYRLDGVLQDVAMTPHQGYKYILSRIKLISELKLNVTDRAQDGRFTIHTGGADIEVRVSTLPGPYGENLVMRILNPKAINVKFEELGMQTWVADLMKKELKKPNGMILNTGPTGSGKTTTLYTFLKTVHEPGVKIITLEDPIEYHIPGIEQTQVEKEKGYDFASGLRAIMRQDPDVILVGEIRDFETAETAVNSSLTGHLVFSTLHTNNAAGAVPRLINLGVKPHLIPPALNVAMAQRLVRRLCPVCKKERKASKDELDEIEKELNSMPKTIDRPNTKDAKIYEAVGCEKCNGTGYKGRVGVFEIMLIDDEMEKVILKEPTEAEIKIAAFKQGQITMRQDGMLKVVAGITDFKEVIRVLG
jgi:type IV pilus assembly protein PilB